MNWDDLRFFNPYGETRQTQNRLAHWQQTGAVYFVTFRLADSVPEEMQSQWEAERDAWKLQHPPPWNPETEREYHQRFSGAVERWLDAGHGSCRLRQPDHRSVVSDALQFFDGDRCAQIAWVVMPNHVHALFVLNAAWKLEHLLKSWKQFSARKINQNQGHNGGFWQRDYFDRLVRDFDHFANCVRYIRRNPAKAHLSANEYTLYESEIARAIE